MAIRSYLLIIMLLFSPVLFGFVTIAHRCAPSSGLENSLNAINTIVLFNENNNNIVMGVEFDIHVSLDGIPVLMHDEYIDRTTNGKSNVCNLTFAELQAFSMVDGQKIPALTQALDIIDRKLFAMIELKCQSAAAPIAAIVDYFIKNKGWTRDDFMVISFNPNALKEFSALMPSIETGFLSYGKVPYEHILITKDLGATYLIPCKDDIDEALIKTVHAAGLKIIAYVINDVHEAKQLIEWGIDGIETDDLTLFNQLKI